MLSVVEPGVKVGQRRKLTRGSLNGVRRIYCRSVTVVESGPDQSRRNKNLLGQNRVDLIDNGRGLLA